MSKNSIRIDGKKLRYFIEKCAGTTIYKICEDNGYSRNLIAQAIRTETASPMVQNLLRLYDIEPSDYIKAEEPEKVEPQPDQITFEDITPLNREEIKGLVKEAIYEILNNSEIVASYNKNDKKVYIMAREELDDNARERK